MCGQKAVFLPALAEKLMLGELLTIIVVLAVAVAMTLAALPQTATWARSCAVLPLLVATAIYLYWRVRNLPIPAYTFGFAWPAFFFGWELLSTVYESWSQVVLTRISDRSSEANNYEARLQSIDEVPSVDVWIATYAEPIEIVAATIDSALRLDYPFGKLKVYVLDDGQHESQRAAELKMRCKQLGAEYIARPKKPDDTIPPDTLNYAGKDGKAGSHLYAFDRTHGEFILQLDADFVVERNFIYRTLGFLLFDPKTGCIQVPQRFRNPDPIATIFSAGTLGVRRSTFSWRSPSLAVTLGGMRSALERAVLFRVS